MILLDVNSTLLDTYGNQEGEGFHYHYQSHGYHPLLLIYFSLFLFTDRRCTGAPDWIIEIVSPGNSSHDYVKKLNLYMAAGVREYWIVDPLQESILLYTLENGFYRVNSYTFQDSIKAGIFEDLSIDFSKLDI